MGFRNSDQLLNAKSASEILDIKPETLRLWARAGKIPAMRVGRGVRFRLADVLALIKDDREKPPTEDADGQRRSIPTRPKVVQEVK